MKCRNCFLELEDLNKSMPRNWSKRYPEQLLNLLREDILERFDDEEFWDKEIIASYHGVDVADLEYLCDECGKVEDVNGNCDCTKNEEETDK